MKKLIIAVLMFIPVAVMAKVDVYKCDASSVTGLDEPEAEEFIITSAPDSPAASVILADDGDRFQVVLEDKGITSAKMERVGKKTSIGKTDRAIFLKRDGMYLITNNATDWLLFNNCKPVNGGKK